MKSDEQLQTVLQKSVDEGHLAGAAVLVLRRGQTHFAAAGWRDHHVTEASFSSP